MSCSIRGSGELGCAERHMCSCAHAGPATPAMLLVENMMNTRIENENGNGNENGRFMLGLLAGSVIGAAVALAFAPRLASELRERLSGAVGDAREAASKTYRDASSRVIGAVNEVSDAASKGYREASSRVTGTVDDVAARGQAVRDDLADVVVRGARTVEQFAAAAKTDAKRA